MTSPFVRAADYYHDIKKVRVDRDNELALRCEALLKRGQNVLLYGDRGVGKTFLLHLIEKHVQESAPTVYSCIVNIEIGRAHV